MTGDEAHRADDGRIAVRDVHEFTVEQTMAATPQAIFRAWTEGFHTWFATPGAIRVRPAVGEPYWFDVVHDGERHPHYGRFLALEPGLLIEQTWVTGKNGTQGAETTVRVELEPVAGGTRIRLTHGGFYDIDSAQRHADSWPQILVHLDGTLARSD